ncbi:MAG: nucleoside-triphosphatase [Methanomicrobiales archaeon]|nr:nucleoside-triphosphatase [Methanomicrobiales archaeon]
MTGKRKNILITGVPGIGKTTLIKGIAEHLSNFHPVGFYTQELRETRTRVGFQLIGLDGRGGILAHINRGGPVRVGKYGVDVEGFESFLSHLSLFEPITHLVIIDEIGRMECYSPRFRELVQSIMDSNQILIATIALRGDSFIEFLKHREDVRLEVLTRENRDSLGPILEDTLRVLADER